MQPFFFFHLLFDYCLLLPCIFQTLFHGLNPFTYLLIFQFVKSYLILDYFELKI